MEWQCKIKGKNVVCKARLPEYMDEESDYETGNDMNSLVNNMVKENQDSFIVVTADWCGHCQQLKSQAGNAWDIVRRNNGKTNILLLDGDQDRQVYQQLGLKVDAYPTIFCNYVLMKDGSGKIFKKYNNKMNKYTQPREVVVNAIKQLAMNLK